MLAKVPDDSDPDRVVVALPDLHSLQCVNQGTMRTRPPSGSVPRSAETWIGTNIMGFGDLLPGRGWYHAEYFEPSMAMTSGNMPNR